MAEISYNDVTGEITAVNHVRGRALDGGTDWRTGFMSVLVGGCCPSSDGTMLRSVRLRFIREELLYDIKNYAFVESDVMGEPSVKDNSKLVHAQHQLADIGETGNIDRVSRILSLVLEEVTDMLYPYTKEAPVEEEIDDVLQVPISYEILLRVPDTMSRTTIRYLSKLIHEYMVYRVMHDWLMITNPEAAVAWKMRTESVSDEIKRIKSNRRKTFTRKMNPF